MNTARAVAQRSLCSRDQVGAVIVSATNRIIDTGYNGPPAGWSHDSTDPGCHVWCPRARAAANTPMQTWVDPVEDDPAKRYLRFPLMHPEYHDCPSLHAEVNALMFGDRAQRVGGTIYVTSTVCGSCAKLIANSGLARVIYSPGTSSGVADSHRDPDRWIAFMNECGLEVRAYESGSVS